MRNPLNLPAGSVRAILALLLVGTVCAIAAVRKELPPGLEGLAGAAIAFYFRSRDTESKTLKEAPDA